ncbi:hypothetical protein CKM354_000634600 [Cercospora kikuchii]|uniref:Ribosomal protein S21 n=1 Tax=Cercospora kikuchii TaxID=84275 RepID=A0A9P3CHZ1_9PEZI|nr:uncharacterized protein CKM354_000634600 [Cercospora kikuchii]GIZ43106.1 hypothetical protein CKM354_000634600 [Cercospora kikuchii]
MAPSRAADAVLRLAAACRFPQTARSAIPTTTFSSSHRAFTATPRQREERRDQPANSSISDDISSLLDTTLDFGKGTPAATSKRPSHLKSRNAQQEAGSQGVSNELQRARSSTQDSVAKLLETMVTKSSLGDRARRGSSYSSADVTGAFSGHGGAPPLIDTKESAPIVLPPNVGRLVEVDEKRNMDVGRAFRTMEILCNKNKVKRTFAQQRFHERPGLKRKRLKNERWIRRFRENFRGTVQLVQKMKKQGW